MPRATSFLYHLSVFESKTFLNFY